MSNPVPMQCCWWPLLAPRRRPARPLGARGGGRTGGRTAPCSGRGHGNNKKSLRPSAGMGRRASPPHIPPTSSPHTPPPNGRALRSEDEDSPPQTVLRRRLEREGAAQAQRAAERRELAGLRAEHATAVAKLGVLRVELRAAREAVTREVAAAARRGEQQLQQALAQLRAEHRQAALGARQRALSSSQELERAHVELGRLRQHCSSALRQQRERIESQLLHTALSMGRPVTHAQWAIDVVQRCTAARSALSSPCPPRQTPPLQPEPEPEPELRSAGTAKACTSPRRKQAELTGGPGIHHPDTAAEAPGTGTTAEEVRTTAKEVAAARRLPAMVRSASSHGESEGRHAPFSQRQRQRQQQQRRWQRWPARAGDRAPSPEEHRLRRLQPTPSPTHLVLQNDEAASLRSSSREQTGTTTLRGDHRLETSQRGPQSKLHGVRLLRRRPHTSQGADTAMSLAALQQSEWTGGCSQVFISV
jgi:hypothetical protein